MDYLSALFCFTAVCFEQRMVTRLCRRQHLNRIRDVEGGGGIDWVDWPSRLEQFVCVPKVTGLNPGSGYEWIQLFFWLAVD
jgi:hypothetical protein